MRLFGRDKKEEVESETAALKGGVATATTTLRDLLIVTYAVPAEKAKRAVPEGLPLDKLPGPDGELIAFAQTIVAFHEGARWSPLPGGLGTSYHQITYRLLTRHAGKRGAFELRTFTSESEHHMTQRALHRQADFARISLYIDGNPATGDYKAYHVRATGDLGKTELEIRARVEPPTSAVPFGKNEEMVEYLTQREEVYFQASAPKEGLGLLPTQTSAMTPIHGEVVSGRMTPWNDLGLLSAEDVTRPLAVFMQSALTVVTSAPRFARRAVPA